MRLRVSLLLFLAAPLLFVHSTSAQTSGSGSSRSAAIQGTVYDPQGRAVPGASVSLLSAMVAVARHADRFQGRVSIRWAARRDVHDRRECAGIYGARTANRRRERRNAHGRSTSSAHRCAGTGRRVGVARRGLGAADRLVGHRRDAAGDSGRGRQYAGRCAAQCSRRRDQPHGAAGRGDERVHSRRKFQLRPRDDRRHSHERFRRRLRPHAASGGWRGARGGDARAGKRAVWRECRRGRDQRRSASPARARRISAFSAKVAATILGASPPAARGSRMD